MIYKKHIVLDLRFLNKSNFYSNFILDLSLKLIQDNKDYFFYVVTNSNFQSFFKLENTKVLLEERSFFDFKFKKLIKKIKKDFVIFFEPKTPFLFKEKYVLFIKTLENIYFHNTKKNIEYFNFYTAIKKANFLVVFDENTKNELNDKFNVNEEKIHLLHPAFKKYDLQDEENLIDLKIKYNIKWEFFIYNAWMWNAKNLDKLIDLFSKVDYSLLILDNDTIKDVNFRKQVIERKLIDKVFFIWDVNIQEKDFFYKNAIWYVYTAIYSSFPFCFNDALNYKQNIIASNLPTIKNIFGDKIIYFNPNNSDELLEKVVKLKKKENNYSEIFNKYNIEKSIIDLQNIIKIL